MPKGQRVVRGVLRHTEGGEVDGAEIIVLDCGIERANRVGSVVTEDGRFELHYQGEGPFNLRVRAKLEQIQLAESPLFLDAAPLIELELLTQRPEARQPPELQRLRRRLEPLLGKTALTALKPDGQAVLAQRSGVPLGVVRNLIGAKELSDKNGLPLPAWYAWLSAGLPASRDAILSHSTGELLKIVDDAVRDHRIGPPPDDLKQQIHVARAVGTNRVATLNNLSAADEKAVAALSILAEDASTAALQTAFQNTVSSKGRDQLRRFVRWSQRTPALVPQILEMKAEEPIGGLPRHRWSDDASYDAAGRHFPTARLVAQLPESNVRSWLKNHPEVELERHPLGAVPEKLKPEIERLARLIRVGGEHTAALASLGFDSAGAIGILSRSAFLARTKGKIPEDRAAEIHVLGRRSRDLTTHLSAQKSADNEVPGTLSLYGCACEHCTSAHSPSAYLVDLLRWLDDEEMRNLLRDRRPDVFALELTCEATDTLERTLDLVLELLELRAGPDPYEKLATLEFPTALPFERNRAETQIALDALGIHGADLHWLQTDMQRAMQEELGLTDRSWRLVAQAQDAAAWGLEAEDFAKTACHVPVFMDALEVSFSELLALLHTRLVPGAALVGSDPCDPSTLHLVGADGKEPLSTQQVQRFRRFVRLQRATELPIRTLDRAIHLFGMDSDGLSRLAVARRMNRETEISLDELLVLWGDLDTHPDHALNIPGDPSPFDVLTQGHGTEVSLLHQPEVAAALLEISVDELRGFAPKSENVSDWSRIRRAVLWSQLMGEPLLESVPVLTPLQSWHKYQSRPVTYWGPDDDVFDWTSEHLGWDVEDLKKVTEELETDWKKPADVHHLYRLMEVATMAGVPAMSLSEWRDAPLEVYWQALDDENPQDWPALREQMEDASRELRRDALMAALNLPAADALQEFLTDVWINSCDKTTRTQFAIAAVQLFVQRMQLNLEPDWALSEEQQDGWVWRRNYRLWEAAVRVFLYPENWVEPELIPDASPFFRTFQSQLRGSDLTQYELETMVTKYVDALHGVSRLSVQSMLWEELPNSQRVLHLVGRSASPPYSWWYRTRTAAGTWTPWTSIPHSIDSDSVVMVVWQGRLNLFWLTLQDMEERSEDATEPPLPYNRIALSWCDLSPTGWQGVKVSTAFIDDRNTGSVADGSLLCLVVPSTRTPLDLEVWSRTQIEADGTATAIKVGRFRIDPCDQNIAAGTYTFVGPPTPPPSAMWTSHAQGAESTASLLQVGGRLLATPTPRPTYIRWQHQQIDAPGLEEDIAVQLGSRSYLVHYEAPSGWDAFWDRLFGTTNVNVFNLSRLYNPFSCEYREQIAEHGAMRLLAPLWKTDDLFRQELTSGFDFNNVFNANVTLETPNEHISFDPTDPYGRYHWELWVYLPWMVAKALTAAGQYERARQWLHVIYNPTGATEPIDDAIWRVKPLVDLQDKSARDLLLLGDAQPNSWTPSPLDSQLTEWEAEPFDPHRVARLRPTAYQRAIVMAYLDNLIAWADELYRRDTRESVAEAVQLYLFAAELLGDRPQEIPDRAERPTLTVDDVVEQDGEFGNAHIEIENLLFAPVLASGHQAPVVDVLFCVPRNDFLLTYWDLVEDRLFKVRNCLDIDGRFREQDPWPPPIDPAKAVENNALGLPFDGLVDSGTTTRPPQRFAVTLRRARGLAQSALQLGQSLLQAMEKRDAEELAELRATHEGDIADATRQLLLHRSRETYDEVLALKASLKSAEERVEWLQERVDEDRTEPEQRQLELMDNARDLNASAQAANLLASFASSLPKIALGIAAKGETGGEAAAAIIEYATNAVLLEAGVQRDLASRTGLTAGYDRRLQNWTHQLGQATRAVTELESKLQAAMERELAIGVEIDIHDTRRQHSRRVNQFYQDRYSTNAMYELMISDVLALNKAALDRALAAAKQVEQCFTYELGAPSASVDGHSNPDIHRLLAAQRLIGHLDRLEAEYAEKNTRRYEITKHVRLSRVDPAALAAFTDEGVCTFWIREVEFDFDFPSHTNRRIKNVAVTIPCVTGPYSGVNDADLGEHPGLGRHLRRKPRDRDVPAELRRSPLPALRGRSGHQPMATGDRPPQLRAQLHRRCGAAHRLHGRTVDGGPSRTEHRNLRDPGSTARRSP